MTNSPVRRPLSTAHPQRRGRWYPKSPAMRASTCAVARHHGVYNPDVDYKLEFGGFRSFLIPFLHF